MKNQRCPKSDARLSFKDLSEIKKVANFSNRKELSKKFKISPYMIDDIAKGVVPSGHFCIRKIINELDRKDLFA